MLHGPLTTTGKVLVRVSRAPSRVRAYLSRLGFSAQDHGARKADMRSRSRRVDAALSKHGGRSGVCLVACRHPGLKGWRMRRLTNRAIEARHRRGRSRGPCSVVLAVMLAVMLAGCIGIAEPALDGRSPIATGAPLQDANATPSLSNATAAPVPVPSTAAPTSSSLIADPSPAGGTVRIPPDSFGYTITDDLRVRTKPGVSAESLKLEPLLWEGAYLYVIDGPVAASGYDWYLVHPLGEVDLQSNPDPPAVGWVAAASQDGDPWLRPAPPDCEEDPLVWLQYDFDYPPGRLAALSCFGESTIRFDALLGISDRCDEGQVSGIEPTWLDPCGDAVVALADPDPPYRYEEVRAIDAFFAPQLDVSALPPLGPNDWLSVNVVGHYDDRAARDCRQVAPRPTNAAARPPELVALDCRASFVITSVFTMGPP